MSLFNDNNVVIQSEQQHTKKMLFLTEQHFFFGKEQLQQTEWLKLNKDQTIVLPTWCPSSPRPLPLPLPLPHHQVMEAKFRGSSSLTRVRSAPPVVGDLAPGLSLPLRRRRTVAAMDRNVQHAPCPTIARNTATVTCMPGNLCKRRIMCVCQVSDVSK